MDADQTFQDIKSLIRQHEAYELMNHLQHWLYHPQATNIERMQYFEYWHLMLLFKWIVQFGDFRPSRNLVSVTDEHIHILFDQLKDLSEEVFPLNSRFDKYIFYRVMCVQQFWVQRKESVLLGWGRQALLFSNLESTHSFRKLFTESVGLNIDDFLDLSCCLFLHFQPNENRHVTESTFTQLFRSVGRETISKWLKAVSSTIPAVQDWLKQTDDGKPKALKGVESEYFEQTPFLRFPLIEARDYYILVSPHVLHSSMSSILYDILRDQQTKQHFMNGFGKKFEGYVGSVLSVLQNPVLTEDDLKRHLNTSDGDKVTDFLAIDSGNNIFIEVKGVALSWKGTISRGPGTLLSESNTSVLKGIKQAYDVASSLDGQTHVNGCLLGTKRNFLLIVTYKDMYFGNGRNFREFVAPDQVNQIIADHDNREVIPLQNIFVICIDDLEIMLGDIQGGKYSLSDFLIQAADNNPNDISRTLAFRNITAAVSGRQRVSELPILTKARDDLFARVERRFQT